MWQVMTAATMLPSCLPAVRHVVRNSLPPRRRLAVWEFLAPYFAVWTMFALAATLLDEGVHRLAEGWAGLGPDSPLPFGAALVVAAAWQLTPSKRACLRSCRRGAVLAAHGRRADLSCLGFGLRYGLSCVGSCWALMLVMFAAGLGHVVWMALLAMLAWAEKARPSSRKVTRPSAAGLAGLAVATVLA
jgi:predicted metal-binding membrane protein